MLCFVQENKEKSDCILSKICNPGNSIYFNALTFCGSMQQKRGKNLYHNFESHLESTCSNTIGIL